MAATSEDYHRETSDVSDADTGLGAAGQRRPSEEIAFVAFILQIAFKCSDRGEAAVRRLLTTQFSSPDYHLMNNVTLRDGDGDSTTQIDHVLVSRFGIFVLESKHYTGWIYGSERNATLTQVLFKKHYKFQNPLRQNYKHVICVSDLLDFLPPGLVHSILVFTGDAVLKAPKPLEVMELGQLAGYLRDFRTEVLSENRLDFCVGRLECRRQALTRQTDVEHVRLSSGDLSMQALPERIDPPS